MQEYIFSPHWIRLSWILHDFATLNILFQWASHTISHQTYHQLRPQMLWTAHSWPNYVKVFVDLVWQKWLTLLKHDMSDRASLPSSKHSCLGCICITPSTNTQSARTENERWINPSILACLHYRTYDTYLHRTTYASLKGSMNPSFLHRPVALFRADARPWWTPGIFPQQCWMKDFCRSFCCCIIVCLPGFSSKWEDSMSLLTAVPIRTQRSLKPWI